MQSGTYTKIFLASCWFRKYMVCRVCNLGHTLKPSSHHAGMENIFFSLFNFETYWRLGIQTHFTTLYICIDTLSLDEAPVYLLVDAMTLEVFMVRTVRTNCCGSCIPPIFSQNSVRFVKSCMLAVKNQIR